MSSLFEDLQWRGLVHQITDPDLPKLLDEGSLTVYIGFDPTAPSLHIGNLLQLCNLRRLQEAGHRPIALAGGGTGMIGDPGGRSDERNLLSPAQLEENMAGIRRQIERFLDFSDGQALMEDNGGWLWGLGYLEFLRDVGKHFTINQMVAKESVRSRLDSENGISYTEFSYMLLQAYDFVHLFDAHGCRLQMGASDQWGNIVMGVDLVRKLRGEAVYSLTTPLVLNSDGTKMGKSAAGDTVWLDAGRTSPYRLYQHFINVDDSMVGTYLRYFTWLDQARITGLDDAVEQRPERREAQRELAWEVTAFVHGQEAAERAVAASEALFSGQVAGLDEATLLEALDGAPSSDATADGIDGLALVDVLVNAGLAKSKGEARRAFPGVYVNGRQVDDADATLTKGDLLHGRYIVLRRGKKNYHLLRMA
ncbi:MAG: tyrosine--tRNA ligase [Acidimicrobiales bacterium]